MAGHGGENCLYIVREHAGMVLDKCMRARGGNQRQRTTRRKPDFDIGPAKTSMDWVASYPETYIGDAHKASAEKGRRMTEVQVERLVEMIRKNKKDRKVLTKVREYREKAGTQM